MANQTTLFDLPPELRSTIWLFAAGTGGGNGLLRTCQLIRREALPYFDLPDEVLEIEHLRVKIDSSYTHGTWLKLDYTWHNGKCLFRAINILGSLDVPLAQRLRRIKKVNRVSIILEALRRGQFLAALMMMLAKCHDTYRLVEAMNDSSDFAGALTISFATEPAKPWYSLREPKPFWECRSGKILRCGYRRKFYSGPEPFYYEYFLVNNPPKCKKPPSIEFGTWPRPNVSSAKTYNGRIGEATLSFFNPRNTYDPRDAPSESLSSRDQFAEVAAKMFMHKDERVPDLTRAPRSRLAWEAVSADFTILNSRFQFFLDSGVGPRGGPLDMLRLHRFKTMDASDLNYFGSATSRGLQNKKGLLGAATEINRRVRSLFNPLAPDQIRSLRSQCEHLAQAEWSNNLVRPSEITSKCPPDKWLQFYPEGIRYNYKMVAPRDECRRVLRWRPQHRLLRRQESPRNDGRWTRLFRWIDCFCCCEDVYEATWSVLSSEWENRIIANWSSIFAESHHHSDDNIQCYCPSCICLPNTCVMLRRQSSKVWYGKPDETTPTYEIMACLSGQHKCWDEWSDGIHCILGCSASCWFCHEEKFALSEVELMEWHESAIMFA